MGAERNMLEIARYGLKTRINCGYVRSFLVAQTVKRLPIMRVDPGSIPGAGRFPV